MFTGLFAQTQVTVQGTSLCVTIEPVSARNNDVTVIQTALLVTTNSHAVSLVGSTPHIQKP